MAGQGPEHRSEPAYDDDPGSALTAFLGALLMDAAIIGLFIFITWVMYATN